MDYQNIRTDDFTLFIQFLLDIFDLYDNQNIEFIFILETFRDFRAI